MHIHSSDRRGFLSAIGRWTLAFTFLPAHLAAEEVARVAIRPAPPASLAGRTRAGPHPEPRPGIDGSAVLPATEVAPHVAELFDRVREVAHLADGIACRCGCGAIEGMRSLLSCYEGVGMAQFCQICEGDGRLVVRLGGEGRTLDEIRDAMDDRARA